MLAKKYVLIADQDDVSAMVLRRMLERRGAATLRARDGAQVLEAVRQGGVDLVITELRLPVLSGFEVARRIRRDPDVRLRDIPILALTADTPENGLQRCLEAGLDGCLGKPFEFADLLTELDRLTPTAACA